MFGVTDLGVFIAGTIAIVLLPGPNSLYVLTVAARTGLRMGYVGALGIFTGDAVLMVLTALGAASVLQAHPEVYHAVRWAGALYLSYLGARLMWGAWQAVRQSQAQEVDAPTTAAEVLKSLKPLSETSAHGVYRKALIISLLNPKAILFFLSFFVQFVDPNYAYPALSFLLLGMILQIASLMYLSALIVGGVRLAQTFAQRRRLSALLSTTVGLLFIAFGLRLAS